MIQLKKKGKKNVVCTNRENHFFPTSLIRIASSSGTTMPRTILMPEIMSVLVTAFQNFSI